MVYANLPTSSDIDILRGGSSVTAVMTESLAESMQSAGQYIESLHLTGLDSESLNATSATRHLFTGLKHLRLDIWNVDFMLKSAPVSSTFASLLKCCQQTVQSLEIMAGGKWPQGPSRGEHYLLKFVSGERAAKAPVFPELRFFGLGSLILNTPSLISFIKRQPQLAKLSFSHLYLATSNIGWPALVFSFPDSVKHWRACGKLGHEPYPDFVPPVAYNWIKIWNPLTEELPEEFGWKAHPITDHGLIDFYRRDDENWEIGVFEPTVSLYITQIFYVNDT